MPTIVVDAMGGEFAPDAAVQGVAEVSMDTDIDCVLVGDEPRLQRLLEGLRYNAEQIEIVHAPDVIGPGEDVREAARRKRQASILAAARLVAAGRGAAVVSAAGREAAVFACVRHFPLLPSVRRVALGSVYQRPVERPGQDPLALLLDAGVTLRCDATELVQFGLMGSVYARCVSKVAAPRVALLNARREDTAGGPELVAAHRELAAVTGIDFVGNVEGHELVSGRADVIVCEGFVGRVVSTVIEGLSEATAGIAPPAAPAGWRQRLKFGTRPRGTPDVSGYGGAPILGFEHVFIKTHGRATARALANAVKVAAKAVRGCVPQDIAAAVESAG